MPVETINVTFPAVVRHLLDSGIKGRDADPVDFDKRARHERRIPQPRINGRPAREIEDVYIEGLRNYGLPFDGSHGPIDLRLHNPSRFKFVCPNLSGSIQGSNIEVLMTLDSAELGHPLAFRVVDPKTNFDNYARLVVFAWGPDNEVAQRTAFFFYPDRFERYDTNIADRVANSQVKVGDSYRLRELAGFLGKSYSRSRLVQTIWENGVKDAQAPRH